MTSVGTIRVIGSGALVQMAGGVVTGTVVYAAAPGIASLSVAAGAGAVSEVVIIEAVFGPAGTLGAKKVFLDEVVLMKTA